MKNPSKILIILLPVCAFFFSGLAMTSMRKEVPLKERQMMQVGIIVKDIEASCRAWAGFFGMEEVPEIMVASGHESTPTQFRGSPSGAKARLAFFRLDNITIELIEPLGGNSTWQEFLDEKGEGIHHIAFDVEDMDASVAACRKLGIREIQSGGWGTGEYSYVDAMSGMGAIIELLEHYGD